jgi:hypothetical protein
LERLLYHEVLIGPLCHLKIFISFQRVQLRG